MKTRGKVIDGYLIPGFNHLPVQTSRWKIRGLPDVEQGDDLILDGPVVDVGFKKNLVDKKSEAYLTLSTEMIWSSMVLLWMLGFKKT